MRQMLRVRYLLAGVCAAIALPLAASVSSSDLGSSAVCSFEQLSGREFEFATADPILQPYGFVLWKTKPSLAQEPLAYAPYQGRRGKLTGRTLVRNGIRWYEGRMDDCTAIFAEDASRNSDYIGVDHLSFHGKIIFADTWKSAHRLIGRQVQVRGAGLEPGQRLYTAERERSYALHDGEWLKVTGVSGHRYAHAKGVGPLFLQVDKASGERGLIKFNPKYLRVADGEFPVRPRRRSELFGPDLAAVVARAEARSAGYTLTVSDFDSEEVGKAAAQLLERDGFNAALSPQRGRYGTVYSLQMAGFPTLDRATAMAGILAMRFNWAKPRVDLPSRAP